MLLVINVGEIKKYISEVEPLYRGVTYPHLDEITEGGDNNDQK